MGHRKFSMHPANMLSVKQVVLNTHLDRLHPDQPYPARRDRIKSTAYSSSNALDCAAMGLAAGAAAIGAARPQPQTGLSFHAARRHRPRRAQALVLCDQAPSRRCAAHLPGVHHPQALRPQAELDALVIARRHRTDAARPPGADQLFTIDRHWKRAGRWAQLRHEWALFQAPRARRYDLIPPHRPQSRRHWRLLKPRWAVAPAGKPAGASPRPSPTATRWWAATAGTPSSCTWTPCAALGLHASAAERGLVLCPSAEARSGRQTGGAGPAGRAVHPYFTSLVVQNLAHHAPWRR